MIGDKGAKYLSQAYFPKLKILYLGELFYQIANNAITGIGVMHLVKGRWNELESLLLGYFYAMKLRISLMINVESKD
jgi:hypothetical protein